MTPNEVLQALTDHGHRLRFDWQRQLVDVQPINDKADLPAALFAEAKRAELNIVAEVKKRTAVMVRQAPPSPLPIPILVYRNAPMQPGCCVSCAEPLPHPLTVRCHLCSLAAAAALDSYPAKKEL